LARPQVEADVQTGDVSAVALGEPAHAEQRSLAHASLRRRSQWSVSEHTNMRPPLSSTTISSRNASRAPHSAQACSQRSIVNGESSKSRLPTGGRGGTA